MDRGYFCFKFVDIPPLRDTIKRQFEFHRILHKEIQRDSSLSRFTFSETNANATLFSNVCFLGNVILEFQTGTLYK